MNQKLSLSQAAQRIESLCKSVWYFDAPKRDYPHSLDYFKRILAKQPKCIWVSKVTGFVYLENDIDVNLDMFLKITIVRNRDKYELYLV